jgi:hypothetical protein
MLQINVQPYASDALEDAMRLAQTKALNSYSWSDCLNYLNYAWMDIYQQLALVDSGYYTKTVRLTRKLTKLPPFFKNSIRVYAAHTSNTYDRKTYRASGNNDFQSPGTYHISGFDLYCPDAERRNVFLEYLPQQPQIFFTRDNRDPKIYSDPDNMPAKKTDLSQVYNLWQISFEPYVPGTGDDCDYVFGSIGASVVTRFQVIMRYRNSSANLQDINVSSIFQRAYGNDAITGSPEPEWSIKSFICDFPYVFVTYQHRITQEYLSGFYHKLPDFEEFIEYNPFAFTGRNSNVEYLQAKWNDKTGLGVIINDWNDLNSAGEPVVKELGWTPDTLLIYPSPELYRYLVARLADKFAALNESEIMAVQRELTEAEFAFKSFIGKDKSSWQRIDNVNSPTPSDWL